MTRFPPVSWAIALAFALTSAPSVGQAPIPAGVTTSGRSAIVTSTGGANPPYTGLNVNAVVGANAFYAAGYTGSTAIVANIEAGLTWNGHETLSQPGHVAQYIPGPGSVGDGNPAAAFDQHATWTGQAIAGRPTAVGGGEHQRGIAPGATLWAGGIATQFNGLSGFNFTFQSFFQPYATAARTGIGGQTADVVNSSWGTFNGSTTSSARDLYSWAIDALVRDTHRVFVSSAGNRGSAADTVVSTATGYNVISVAALTGDQASPPFNAVADFSSRGPNYAFDPAANGGAGQLIANARIRVDLTAPGTNLTLAYYGGATGSNAGGSNTPGTNLYTSNLNGTSFAAPIVAGGAALLVDAGRQLGLTNSADGRVVKAVLLNSADKTAGWNNAQAPSNGVVTTTQALDPAAGAGRMNLAAALPYYADPTSTRDVPGTATGDLGVVGLRGYDFGRATLGAANAYTLAGGPQPALGQLTVTLNWFANRTINSFDNPTALDEAALANLNLEVWRLANGSFDTLYARSASVYNNTEHLHLTNLPAGEYGFRVVYTANVWDFIGQNTETYALAWDFTPVPEPGWLLTAAVAAIVWRRRRRAAAG